MPASSRDKVFKDIQNGRPSPSYLLCGPAQFLVEECLTKMVDLLIPPDQRDFGLDQFHGPELDGALVASSARMTALMGDRRVVVVKGFDPRKVANPETLAAYMKAPVDTTVVIVTWHPDADSAWERSSSPGKGGSRKKGAIAWPELFRETLTFKMTRPDTIRWIQDRAAGRKLKLDQAAATLIFETLGEDSLRVDSELERLSLSVEGPVGVEALAGQLRETRHRFEWELRQAVWDRNLGSTLRLAARLTLEGAEPVLLVGILSSALGVMLEARLAVERGTPPLQAAADAKVVLFKQKEFAEMLSGLRVRDVASAIEDLQEVDIGVKQTSKDPGVLLDVWALRQKGLFQDPKPRKGTIKPLTRSRGGKGAT